MLSISVPKTAFPLAGVTMKPLERRQVWNLARAGSSDSSMLRADFIETEDCYEVVVEVPGLGAGDIGVSLENELLIIEATRTAPEAENDEVWHLRERPSGTFSRSFSLPSPVRCDDVEATCTNGILRVALPKRDEAKRRSIEVKSG